MSAAREYGASAATLRSIASATSGASSTIMTRLPGTGSSDATLACWTTTARADGKLPQSQADLLSQSRTCVLLNQANGRSCQACGRASSGLTLMKTRYAMQKPASQHGPQTACRAQFRQVAALHTARALQLRAPGCTCLADDEQRVDKALPAAAEGVAGHLPVAHHPVLLQRPAQPPCAVECAGHRRMQSAEATLEMTSR